jgi:dimethylargininase
MTQRVALVRRPSSRLGDGLVTHVARTAVDPELAAAQHAGYVAALAGAGWHVVEAPPADDLADSAFIEDTVVVCDGLAVLTRPGAVERQPEVAGVAETVAAVGLETAAIEAPGTLDGGDVLQVGSTVYVGLGGRTNASGIDQLAAHVRPLGRTVVTVSLREVLHLKSAVTALPDGTIVCADDRLVDMSPFSAVRPVPEEGGSHVVLLGGDRVLMAASAPRSAEQFRSLGLDVVAVDIGEFERMEGCVTCLSVLVSIPGDPVRLSGDHPDEEEP